MMDHTISSGYLSKNVKGSVYLKDQPLHTGMCHCLYLTLSACIHVSLFVCVSLCFSTSRHYKTQDTSHCVTLYLCICLCLSAYLSVCVCISVCVFLYFQALQNTGHIFCMTGVTLSL